MLKYPDRGGCILRIDNTNIIPLRALRCLACLLCVLLMAVQTVTELLPYRDMDAVHGGQLAITIGGRLVWGGVSCPA